MDLVKILVGVILPYVAVLVFLVGMIYRLSTWKKLASPPMTLFPAPPTEQANTINTLQEAFLFKSLFSGDRVLWILAWTFHAVLALIVLGHFRVFTSLIDSTLKGLGMSEDGIHLMSGGAGGAAGLIILAAVVLLLIRRLTLPRVREITGTADYLALLLITAIIITGNMMRFCYPEQYKHFLTHTREYFGNLMTFSLSGITQMHALDDNLFLVHMCLAFLLVIAIPFSKILHLGGIFFTHQLIRKQ
jgi:nitrate reductase gamma subunit